MKLESIKIIAKRYRHTAWKNEEMLEVLAEIERLQDENKRLSEQVDDLKMDIGFLRGKDK